MRRMTFGDSNRCRLICWRWERNKLVCVRDKHSNIHVPIKWLCENCLTLVLLTECSRIKLTGSLDSLQTPRRLIRTKLMARSIFFAIISSCYAIFKNVVHSLEPGETPSYSAFHQASNYTVCATFLNIAKYFKTLRCGCGTVAFIFSIYLKPGLYEYSSPFT